MNRLHTLALAAAALLALAAVPAHAMNWSLGANLGMSVVMGDNDADATAFGWPTNVLPGLRVGFMGDNPRHEFYVDNTLDIFDGDVVSTSRFIITGNYQHNFPTAGRTGVFLTGGLGFVNQGAEIDTGGPLGTVDVSATAPIFGGGVGLRHKMGNGHGVLRGEVRFDFRSEGDDDGAVLFEDATIVSFKLGFDFWDQQLR